ncbi:MAG: amino acid/amide transporter substrate-binding protein family [Polaromonas sp.]|nr:amino acid/amide transporter substrate-binding protein family [Polaromonas sp.]
MQRLPMCPPKTMEELGKDPAQLKAVLTSHVLHGKLMSADIKNSPVKTVDGASVAVKTLSVMGIHEIGAVYASPRNYVSYRLETKRIATQLGLKLQAFQANGELRSLGQKLGASTPAVLLFVGGTPELAEFTQGLEKQARQRYIVALADVCRRWRRWALPATRQ